VKPYNCLLDLVGNDFSCKKKEVVAPGQTKKCYLKKVTKRLDYFSVICYENILALGAFYL